MDQSPVRMKEGILLEDLDEEIVILDTETDEVHILNETAAQLWRLIDGVRNRQQIASAFGRQYPEVEQEIISQDVNSVLDDFQGKRLLVGSHG